MLKKGRIRGPDKTPSDLLEGVDVGDQLADGLDALGLAELDLALLLEVADELHHVEGVDAQRLHRGVLGDLIGVDVEILGQHFLDGVDRSHVRSFPTLKLV